MTFYLEIQLKWTKWIKPAVEASLMVFYLKRAWIGVKDMLFVFEIVLTFYLHAYSYVEHQQDTNSSLIM